MTERLDCLVIGGGPGGYAAAIRCAQKGVTVGLVEKDAMGGTCLNRGCIPSKALLGSAHFLTLAKHAPLMGVDVGPVTPNWAKMQARKDTIVKRFRAGVTGLVQSNRIKLFNGRSVAHNESIGEIRVIKNKANDKIVGVTMVGAAVTEMLAAARALIGSSEQISDVCFAHPTVSEVLKEAWEDTFGISLHLPPPKK